MDKAYSAWDAGEAAALAGDGLTSNPHTGSEGRAWYLGWKYAREHTLWNLETDMPSDSADEVGK